MLDISIYITLHNKADINNVITILRKQHIDKPVYIVDLDDRYRISFDSEYEYFEIETDIIKMFKSYEFVSDVGKGRKEIRMQIHRIQSPFSSDGWGRQFNSDTIETTTYLVRKNKSENIKTGDLNTTFKVLFGETEREYTINVVPGINKVTNEKGFILIKRLNDEGERTELIENRLFRSKAEAFWHGFQLSTRQIEQDFDGYKKSIKLKRKKKQ